MMSLASPCRGEPNRPLWTKCGPHRSAPLGRAAITIGRPESPGSCIARRRGCGIDRHCGYRSGVYAKGPKQGPVLGPPCFGAPASLPAGPPASSRPGPRPAAGRQDGGGPAGRDAGAPGSAPKPTLSSLRAIGIIHAPSRMTYRRFVVTPIPGAGGAGTAGILPLCFGWQAIARLPQFAVDNGKLRVI